MSLIAVRVAMARENFEDAPLTQEEQLMTAPPDVAAQDPEVAEAVQAQASDTLGADTMQLLDDGAAVSEVIDTVKEAGPEISPEAVLVAQERLSGIFRRYGLESRRIAREDITADIAAGTENPGPYSAAQDLITDAEKNLEYIKVAAAEGLRELGQRVAVNMQNMFKWRSTYVKDARAVAKAAAAVVGSPSDAQYTNKIRIAHFTDGAKNVLTTAKQLDSAFATSRDAIKACRLLQEQMERVFVFFTQGSGKVDLNVLRGAFEPSSYGTDDGKTYLSLSGKAAIFGEEFVMSGFHAEGVTENQESMLAAFSDVRYKHVNHWTVKELENLALPVMSAAEVAKNANALTTLAANLNGDFSILDSLIDFTNRDDRTFSEHVLQGLTNPKLFLRFRNVVLNTIVAMEAAGNVNIDLKAKALNCVLDYYKWSLNNHKNTSTEGFLGGLVGFILGGIPIPGIPTAVGIASRHEADRLKKEIVAISKDIAELQHTGTLAALKEGKIDEEASKKQLKVDWKAVVEGAVLGTLFAGIYGAIQGSRIQNRKKELDEKIEELNKLMQTAKAAKGK